MATKSKENRVVATLAPPLAARWAERVFGSPPRLRARSAPVLATGHRFYLDSGGHPFDAQLSTWRPLNSNELELHFVLSTVVARWLQHNHPELHPVEGERGEKPKAERVM